METNNLELWQAVRDVDPHYLDFVSYGKRKFATIDAYWLFEKATEQWGPMGKAWGLREASYQVVNAIDDVTTVVLTAHFFYPDGAFPIAADWPFRQRDEVYKKVTTSALKKALSYLGFGASVYQGQFEDEATISKARERWDKEHSHENAVQLLNNQLNVGIGCKTDEDRDLVCQWATEPGMVYEKICETEGAPSAVINGIRKRTKEGLSYPEVLEEARRQLIGEE